MPDAQRAEIAKLEALHAEHPQGRIFTHLAEAYRKAGELERAREVLSDGIARHPEYSSAHVVLARVLADMGEGEAAASEFGRVLELDPHNLVALRSLGDIARSAGRTDEALDYYGRLLDVEPSDDDVRNLVRNLEAGPAPQPEEADTAAGTGVDGPAGGPEPRAEEPPSEERRVEEVRAEEPRAEEPRGVEPGPPDADADVPWSAGEGAERVPDADEAEPWVVGGQGNEAERFPETWDEAGVAGAAPAAAGDPVEAGDEAHDSGPVGPGDDEPGVMTETIAQVYARQGLYDRAADVYRELVRSRPDDQGLRTRLEEMEALAAAPGAGDRSEPAEPIFEREEPAAAEVEPLAGLETHETDPDTGLWTGEGDDLASGAGTGALDEEPAGTDASDPWAGEEEAPWSADADEAEDPWAEPTHAAGGPVDGPEPDVHDGQDGHDAPVVPMAGGLDGAGDDIGEDAAEAVESVWTGAEGAPEESESPYAWSGEGEVEPADESAPIASYLRSLLDWGGDVGSPGGGAGEASDGGESSGVRGGVGAEPAERGGETASTEDVAPMEAESSNGESTDAGRAEGERADAGRPAPGSSARGAPDDDDDLDTFRTWLESLKQ